MGKKLNKNAPLEAKIIDDKLVISIGYKTLAYAVTHRYDPEYRHYSIIDELGFVKDILRQLDKESEIGESPLTKLLDNCAEEAVNQGSQYVKHKKAKFKL